MTPSGPWAISIRTPKKSIMKVVVQKENESLKRCLDRAKDAVKVLKEKYAGRTDIIIEIISRRRAFDKPEKVQVKANELWCPYCVKPRQFKKGQLVEIDGVSYLSDYRRCIICLMSDQDYYVQHYNHLWPVINMRGK